MHNNSFPQDAFDYLTVVYQECLDNHLKNPKYQNLSTTLSDISNGTKILENDGQVDAYIALYGAQHYYKLVSAFDNLELSNFIGKSLEFISYGCGPATDTCVLKSYLTSKQINLDIKSVTLIEPSLASLKRGKEYVQSAFKIREVNKTINELNINDIASQPDTVKLHVFSNILDIKDIDLERLANLLKESQKGANYFVCISPTRYNEKRIDNFYDIMSNLFEISDISITDETIKGRVYHMKQGGFNNSYPIDRYERIFFTYAN